MFGFFGRRRFGFGNNYDSSDSDSDREERDLWGDLLGDSDDSDRPARHRSPSPPKPKIKLQYDDEDNEMDTECEKISQYSCKDQCSSIEIKYCNWGIPDFSSTDLHKKKGHIRSNVYVAGNYNQFQFYFVMEKLKTDDDTHFGVYVNVLSNVRSEARVFYKSYFIELRGHKYPLHSSKTQKFPTKPGFRFLGSVSKSRFMDDDYWTYRFLPDDKLQLGFKITVNYKTRQSFNELEQLFEKNSKKDITIVVKGEKFPANRKILMTKSPVFAKLLEKQSKAKSVEIKNVDPEIMKQLLIFIYTGRVTKLFTYTEELSAAADKYKLKALKAMCKKVKS